MRKVEENCINEENLRKWGNEEDEEEEPDEWNVETGKMKKEEWRKHRNEEWGMKKTRKWRKRNEENTEMKKEEWGKHRNEERGKISIYEEWRKSLEN